MIHFVHFRHGRHAHWSAVALIVIVGIIVLLYPRPAHTQSVAIGTAKQAVGTLVVEHTDGVQQRLQGKGQLPIFEGDELKTDRASRAWVELNDGIHIALNKNTSLTIHSRWEKATGTTRILRLKHGEIWGQVTRQKNPIEIETPIAVASANDSEFFIEALDNGNSILTVVDGVVKFGTSFGTCPIRSGTMSYAVNGKRCTKPEPIPAGAIAGWTDAFKESGAISFPLFWPPPDASAYYKIPREILLGEKPTEASWASVAKLMEQALAANGYSEPGYYAVPHGFALISQLERINEDATPAPPNMRWKIKVPAVSIGSFSLANYLKALLGKDAGYFRVIAFIFTPLPIVTSGVEPSMEAEAKLWVAQGATGIPRTLAMRHYGEDMIATALVYEFEIPSQGAPARLRKPSNHSGQRHLMAAKILQTLGR